MTVRVALILTGKLEMLGLASGLKKLFGEEHADPAGAANAGVPSEQLPVRTVQGQDPECFVTDDAAYIVDDGSACTKWKSLPTRYQGHQRPEWLNTTHPRERHPKRYLAWLCRDPGARNCSSFRERPASDALVRLSWAQVLQNPHHMTFARSLICDLADGLGYIPPGLDLEGTEALLTSIHAPRAEPVLRNL